MRCLLLVGLGCLACACSTMNPQQAGTFPISHERWTALLQKHVTDEGWVNYQGFLQDRPALQEYLEILSKNAPNDTNWSDEAQMAYWINAYNAFTVELVLQYYPIGSIKDIGSSIQVPFVNSPWDIRWIEIGGQALDLNNIEHNILRKRWQEPRIHFAINCASVSCPPLRREAYTGVDLEQQLADQTSRFLNDTTKNQFDAEEVRICKIFSWFGADFTRKSTLTDFINKHRPGSIAPGAEIRFLPYDWRLNELQ